MKWSLEKATTIGYGIALALVVAMGIVSYWTTAGFIEASRAVAQRSGSIESLDQTVSWLKDANVSVLAYLPGGEPRSLIEYTNAVKSVERDIKQLQSFFDADVKQTSRLQNFETNATGNFALLGRIIAARTSNPPDWGAIGTATRASQALLATNQLIIAEMKSEQGQLMLRQSEESEAVGEKTTSIVLVGSFLTLAIVSWAILIINRDLNERKKAAEEREKLIAELQEALTNIKTLGGLLPICAWCKKIRDDKGYWNQVDAYIQQHTAATFSHGLCPECMRKMNEELQELKGNQGGAGASLA
ncbi:MAG: CHASE3 domain-containing protein [Limisphaerales bacterium]